jgi:nucleoside-diphosphate-sugar epimerase
MVVVTTPTGRIGSQVLEALLAANETVRVIVRDENKLPADVREKVESVRGSHRDAATVKKAFKGSDAVFWLVPPDPQAQSAEAAYVDFSRPAYDAFRAEGVKRVVGVSSLGRGKPPIQAPRTHSAFHPRCTNETLSVAVRVPNPDCLPLAVFLSSEA